MQLTEQLPPKKKPRLFRRIVFSFFIIFTTIILSAVLFSFLYSDAIKQYAISSINKNLDAEVKVEQIDFSVLSSFPYASINFKGVIAKEPKRLNTTDTLLNAKELSLLFNIMDVINKKYDLKKIVLSDAELHLKINKNGENNYKIWKTDSASSGDFKMELEELNMQHVKVTYNSIPANQDYSFEINDGTLSGNFSSENYLLKSSADVLIKKFVSAKTNFIKDKNAKVELVLKINQKTDTYTFENSDLQIAGLRLVVNGIIVQPKEYTLYDLNIQSKDADLKSLLSVIPSVYTKNLNDYNFNGKVFLNAGIKGKSDKTQIPAFNLDVKIANTTIALKNSDYKLEDVKFEGAYTNRKAEKKQLSYLSVKNFYSRLNGRTVTGNFQIENFKDPLLHFEANASADLSALSKFFKPDTLENISGEVLVNNAIFNGRIKDISTYVSSGNISLKNVSFKLKQKPTVVSDVHGDLVFNKNNLKIVSLGGKTAASDFSFTGNVDNLYGYFFSKNQKLSINASMQSTKLDLNEVMEKNASASQDTIYKIRFADNLAFRFNITVGEIHFNKFSATDVNGIIELNNSQLITHALQFNAMDGSVSLQGSIREIPKDSLIIQYDASVKKLDINKMFYEMGNFGQAVITEKNLRGKVTADVQFFSKWKNTLDCNLSTVQATSAISIENGELLNFTPMLALSHYIKGADLNDIKFSDLKTTIEIRDRQIFIPSTEINSSALNIVAKGTHGFDNMIEYHLQLLLSQLLGKKVKNLNTEFGTIEDDNLGRTRLFITMKGPADNPKFSYDTKSVKEKITADISRERQNLKEILKKEFSPHKNGELPLKETTQKQQELEIDASEEEPNKE